MITRTLGTKGPHVAAIGLGCMGMSDLYGPADEAESIATIYAALDAGITLLDTGDFYGMGHNELRLAEEKLVVPHAVEVARVEQGYARIERGVDGGDALGLISRAIQIGHAHAAEADRSDVGSFGTKSTCDHVCLTSS